MIHKIFNIDSNKCTQRVIDIFDNALKRAVKARHEFITPEHLLDAIIHLPEFGEYCKTHYIDQQKMADMLNEYLDSLDSVAEDDMLIATDDTDEFLPIVSVALRELIDMVFMPYELADGKEKASVGEFLLRMVSLNDTTAQFLVNEFIGEDYERWGTELSQLFDSYIPAKSTPNIKARAFVNGKEVELTAGEMYDKLVESAGRLMKSISSLKPDMAEIIQASDVDSNVDDDIYDDDDADDIFTDDDTNLYLEDFIGSAELPFGDNNQHSAHTQHAPWLDLVTDLNKVYKRKNPLVGRQQELRHALRILSRHDKNNPIFIGEPGVGKTALIYGLARLIEEAKADASHSKNGSFIMHDGYAIPAWLCRQKIFEVDMAAIVAGASYHGEFERRMKMILDGARDMGDCILYIDEIHSIMGAGGGGNNNALNAADMMKPFLDDSSIKFIGSTTYQDYNKTIANNKAMARRFGKIDVKEPSVDDTVQIINALLPVYAKHHNVKYTEEAVRYAVEQSNALITDRYLPDKAIDIIDEAGAWLQQNPQLNKNGMPKQHRYQRVDVSTIKHVLTDICRIDAKALTNDDNAELRNLDKRIANEIYGQDEAIRQVVRAVMMSKAGLTEPEKPLASLLFVGPTGVGKTEVCKVLARELGVELVRFDMSEYTEKHTVSKLIGSPAGYVGYDEGGLLTDAIRKTPNCVLLLDEIEKAHADIYNILLQVMDYARLTDNKGNKADFKNVILIMTSNAGAQYASQAAIGFGQGQSKGQAMMNTVKKTFKPEFLNRLSGTVVFNDMDETMAKLILDKKLQQLQQRLSHKNITMTLSEEAKGILLRKGFTQQYGAREMDRAIQQLLTPLLMDEILFGRLQNGGTASVDVQDGKLTMIFT